MSQVILTRLHDGDKYITQHVYLKSDGGSELDSIVLVDPASTDMKGLNKFAIDDITWAFNGFSAKIHFELLESDTLIWVLPPSTGNIVDFTTYGGLYDRGSLLDASGKILLTTTGFGAVGDEGSMILRIRKHK